MNAFDPPPSCFDPEWLSRQTLESIRREGSDATNVEWIRRFYAWIYQRSPERENWPKPTAQPKAPPSGFFPVLLASSDSMQARLSFLSISYVPRIVENHVSASSTEAAANWAWRWAQNQSTAENHSGGDGTAFYARVSRPSVDGESDGLAAFTFVLMQNLLPTGVDDVCATGRWNAENKCFEPVTELSKKASAAEQWGYRRLLYVAGQDGVPHPINGMQLIVIPSDPLQAAKAIRNVIDPLPQRIRRGLKGWLVAALFAVVMVAMVTSKIAEYASLFVAIVVGLRFLDAIHGGFKARKSIRAVIAPMLGLIAAACLALTILRRLLDAPSQQLENWFAIYLVSFLFVMFIRWVWQQLRSV